MTTLVNAAHAVAASNPAYIAGVFSWALEGTIANLGDEENPMNIFSGTFFSPNGFFMSPLFVEKPYFSEWWKVATMCIAWKLAMRRAGLWMTTLLCLIAIFVSLRSFLFREFVGLRTWSATAGDSNGVPTLSVDATYIGIFLHEGNFAFGKQRIRVAHLSAHAAIRLDFDVGIGRRYSILPMMDGQHTILSVGPSDQNLFALIGIVLGSGSHGTPSVLRADYTRLRLPSWILILGLACWPIRHTWMEQNKARALRARGFAIEKARGSP